MCDFFCQKKTCWISSIFITKKNGKVNSKRLNVSLIGLYDEFRSIFTCDIMFNCSTVFIVQILYYILIRVEAQDSAERVDGSFFIHVQWIGTVIENEKRKE